MSTAAPSAASSSRRFGLNTVAPWYAKKLRYFGSTTTGSARLRSVDDETDDCRREDPLVVVLQDHRVGFRDHRGNGL